jgi:hypothetical protein
MSFNLKRVPPINELIEELEKYPEHLKFYQKADALIGPPDAVDYLMSLNEDDNNDI